MHPLTPEYLAALRFDGTQVATLRSLGECQGRQQPHAAQSPEALEGLCRIAVVESTESSNRLEGVVVIDESHNFRNDDACKGRDAFTNPGQGRRVNNHA
jgi:hypothetical protein